MSMPSMAAASTSSSHADAAPANEVTRQAYDPWDETVTNSSSGSNPFSSPRSPASDFVIEIRRFLTQRWEAVGLTLRRVRVWVIKRFLAVGSGGC